MKSYTPLRGSSEEMEEILVSCHYAVDDLAAHYTTDHSAIAPEGWEREMVFQNGDLVKLDVGVHINGHIGDNALTIEVGNQGNHTEQIKAAKEARDSAIEMLHPGTPWYKVGAAAAQPLLMQVFSQLEIYVVIN